MLAALGQGKILKNQNGQAVMGVAENGAEYIVAGLPHLDDQLVSLGSRSREDLRRELSQRLGDSFSPSRPLLLHIISPNNDLHETRRGLRALCEKADVLVKTCGGLPLEAGSRYIPIGEELFYLARYAADAVLSGITAGSLSTDIMLGLKALPVFTTCIHSLSSGERFNHKAILLSSHQLPPMLAARLDPLNIEDSAGLLRRATDPSHWNADRYGRKLRKLQDTFFGYYPLGSEGVKIAAEAIKRKLASGRAIPLDSLKDASAVKAPRPPSPPRQRLEKLRVEFDSWQAERKGDFLTEVLFGTLRIEFSARELDELESQVKCKIDDAPDQPDYYRHWGAIYAMRHQPQKGLPRLHDALNTCRKRPGLIWAAIGSLHLAAEDFNLAVEDYQKALDTEPQNMGWLYSLSLAKAGDIEGSNAALVTILDLEDSGAGRFQKRGLLSGLAWRNQAADIAERVRKKLE